MGNKSSTFRIQFALCFHGNIVKHVEFYDDGDESTLTRRTSVTPGPAVHANSISCTNPTRDVCRTQGRVVPLW